MKFIKQLSEDEFVVKMGPEDGVESNVRYAVNDCTAVDGDGTVIYRSKTIIPEYVDIVYGETVYAPTYAEVIDWLHDKGFVVELDPVFIFSTKDHLAYFFNLYEIDNDVEGRLDLIYNDPNWMGSLEHCIKDIVKWLIQNELI